MTAVQAALAWQLYQQTDMPAVHAGRTVMGHGSCTNKTARLAVPADLSWQLNQQDCLASCTNRTTGDVVTCNPRTIIHDNLLSLIYI
jgi:hypothetical protein